MREVTDTLTVSGLTDALSETLSERFPNEIWVTGAIRSLTRSANGHVYFDLIDPEHAGDQPPAVPVVLFESTKTRINQILRKSGAGRMEDGVEIRLRGRLAMHASRGRFQLVMSLIDPAFTLGRLAAERAALLQRLADDGLLDTNGRLPMPRAPLKVALITSAGSAAHADFLDELARSRYRFEVTTFDARVQGPDAVSELTDALRIASRDTPDVIVVTRGGGSRGDLVAFDHERLARAIATAAHPVIVGVGHEIDRSVADEVAHLSVKTPTAAARSLIDRCDLELAALVGTSRRVAQAAVHVTTVAGAELDRQRERLGVAARAELGRAGDRLDRDIERVRRTVPARLERAHHSLSLADATVRGADPAVQLARGWSLTRTVGGDVVTSPDQVGIGDELEITVSGGRIRSTVQGLEPTDGSVDEPAEDTTA